MRLSGNTSTKCRFVDGCGVVVETGLEVGETFNDNRSSRNVLAALRFSDSILDFRLALVRPSRVAMSAFDSPW